MQKQNTLSKLRCFLGEDEEENVGLTVHDISADEIVVISPDYILPGSTNATIVKDEVGLFLTVSNSRAARCIKSIQFENQWEVILLLEEPLTIRTLVRYGLPPERFIRHTTQWIGKLSCGVECAALVKAFTLTEIYCIALEGLKNPCEEMNASLQFFDPDSQQDISLIGVLEVNEVELVFHPQFGLHRGLTELLMSDSK